jgi:hypothetical protein
MQDMTAIGVSNDDEVVEGTYLVASTFATGQSASGNYINSDNTKTYINTTNLECRFEIVFSDTSVINANCLGLFVTDNETDILFSRVTFPTQYKSSSEKLTFKYYIYF